MYNNFLVVGATGATGVEIVRELLKNGKKVTILVRNKTKAKTVFKEVIEKISNVVEGELGLGESLKNNDLVKVFRETDCVISALGSTYGENPKINDYDSIKELIELSEQAEVKKFIFVTSLYITRPYTFVAYILNNIIPFVLGWKCLAENKLRLSKLNYMIIRPGQLLNKVDEEKSVGVFQGDKVKGKISRNNLAKGILKALANEELNKEKVTLDFIEVPKTEKFLVFDKIAQDDEDSIITKDHFAATKMLNMIFFSLFVSILIYLIYKFK